MLLEARWNAASDSQPTSVPTSATLRLGLFKRPRTESKAAILFSAQGTSVFGVYAGPVDTLGVPTRAAADEWRILSDLTVGIGKPCQ